MTDFENSIEQELDFEKLTELCDNLKEAVREILNSCGMYFRIFSRVKSPNSIAEFDCRKTVARSIRNRAESKKITGSRWLACCLILL